MGRKFILLLALTLVAALGLVAAGCGGGGSNETAATTTTETTAPATTEEETTTEATETTEETTTEEATTTTSDLSGLTSAENCRELADLGSKFSSAFSGAASGTEIKKQAALFEEFANKVPEDIRADFQVIASYFSKIAEVAGDLKVGVTPDAATLAKLQKLSTEIDQAKLTQASTNISAWVQKNCAG